MRIKQMFCAIVGRPDHVSDDSIELHDMPPSQTNFNDEHAVEELLERASRQHLSGRHAEVESEEVASH